MNPFNWKNLPALEASKKQKPPRFMSTEERKAAILKDNFGGAYGRAVPGLTDAQVAAVDSVIGGLDGQ